MDSVDGEERKKFVPDRERQQHGAGGKEGGEVEEAQKGRGHKSEHN